MREYQHTKAAPSVVYAQLKFMWSNGARDDSIRFLRSFATSLARDLQVETAERSRTNVSKQRLEELSKLLARCYYKQGEWQSAVKENWDDVGSLSYDVSAFLTV